MTNEYTQISEKAIAGLKKNHKAIARLMIAFNRGSQTIEDWMRSRDIRLTTAMAVQIISEETGLTEDEILTTNVHPVAA